MSAVERKAGCLLTTAVALGILGLWAAAGVLGYFWFGG